ncbi:ComEC/Rec2 family competence protein [Sphingomonas sp. URHD0057]|uniref:ComEC/Rec2 family competence protein n=1 Tax=Sphingomonas sp. URHD0057 TaxID=1380389 RepID=UPI0009DEC990|nr:ComEC/Rec2 family competence protein [Sphingomonas sp. URHD0057]
MGEAPLPQRARSYWKTRISALHEELEKLLEAERAQLPPWLVVGFGTGIAAWFALDVRAQWAAVLFLCAGLAVAGFALVSGRAGRALGWFALAATLGCALVWARSARVAEPRLARPIVTDLSARVESVDFLAAKDPVRLILAPSDPELPPHVRVSVDETDFPAGIAPGAEIRLKARLAPPPPMALPGTYDFSRDAWFKGLGAVGKAMGPVTVSKAAKAHGLDRMRAELRQHILEHLPSSSAGIAIALATGDQNAVGADDAEAMRRSGLTHLLSVSGLHIAAVVAFAMFLTLKLLALSERLALRFNLVLAAAAVAALAGIGYTLLTGAQVPTVRSCVAALLILAGIALGRDAISIRLIAVGALVVLLFRPEALAGASFQMSFAAVTAIVALHSTAWSRRWFQRRDEGVPARLLRALAGMIATGLVVELALVPLALFHFHRSGLYGVGANIIAIPLTTFVIMPLEAGALLLDVAGWGKPLWLLCGVAIDGLIRLAHAVASAKGAVALIPSMPAWAFGLIAVGGVWLCLWSTPLRRWGLVPALIGAAGAAAAPSPDLLVTGDGKHLAIVRDGTPFLLRERAGDFVRQLLAEASGFDGDPLALGIRPFSACSRDACVAIIHRDGRDWRILATRSNYLMDWQSFIRACGEADVIVSDRRLPRGCVPRWLKLDRPALARMGGVSIVFGDTPRVETVADHVGAHPWVENER